VFFVAGAAKDVLTVPIAALQGRGQGEGLQTAHVLTGKGDVQKRQVRTGLSDRLRVQILDGLEEGDKLLIGPVGGEG